MRHYQKQTQQKNDNSLTIIVCVLVAFAGVAFGLGQRETLQMERYAATNNCTWVFNGTYYWDDRDYTCK